MSELHTPLTDRGKDVHKQKLQTDTLLLPTSPASTLTPQVLAAIGAVLTAPLPPAMTQGATSSQTLTSRKERTLLHSNHTTLPLPLPPSPPLSLFLSTATLPPKLSSHSSSALTVDDDRSPVACGGRKRCGGQLPRKEGHEATTTEMKRR